MKKTALVSTKKSTSIITYQPPLDLLNRIVSTFDWKVLSKIAQVSKFWHSLVCQLCNNFSKIYFPYFKYISTFVKNPLNFILKERLRYEGNFSQKKLLLILAALNDMNPIDGLEEEKEKIKLYSLFLTSDNPTLSKNLTENDHARLKSLSEEDKNLIRICAYKYFACNGQLESIKQYLLLIPTQELAEANRSALRGAVKFNHLAMVKKLLSLTKFTPQDRELVLKDAVRYYRIEIIQFFLSLRETPKASAFELAATKGYIEIVTLFLPFYTGRTIVNEGFDAVSEVIKLNALCAALKNNQLEVVKHILLYGEITAINKLSVLITAIEHGYVEIVRLIISFEEMRPEYLRCALINAVEHNHPQIVECLLSNEKIITEDKIKALRIATQRRHMDIVNQLLFLDEIPQQDKNQIAGDLLTGSLLSPSSYTPLHIMRNNELIFSKSKFKNNNNEKISRKSSHCIIS